MLKLETNTGVICIGAVSILFAIVSADWPFIENWLFFYILHALGSAGLILGAYTQKRIFFVLWMILAAWVCCLLPFAIALLFMWTNDSNVFLILGPIWLILCLAFYSVVQAFNRIGRMPVNLIVILNAESDNIDC